MRIFFSLILACAMGLRLIATEQLINVTPQALDGWTVSGADKTILGQADQVVLPPSSQLDRGFIGSAVVLHLSTQPVFSENPADWPIVGVGQAAAAFIRQGDEGRVVLVIGESRVIDLPWTVSLMQKGQKVELVLAYDPQSGAGLISLEGNLRSFDAPPSGKTVEVLLMAGEKTAWPQDLMQVLLLGNDPDDSSTKDEAVAADAQKTVRISQLQTAANSLLGNGHAGTGTSGSVGAVGNSPANATVSTLEVFTPPAVRHARIAAVRAAVVRSKLQ